MHIRVSPNKMYAFSFNDNVKISEGLSSTIVLIPIRGNPKKIKKKIKKKLKNVPIDLPKDLGP
jgi:hypothetical protein